jgi:hypothetical protein
LAQVRFAGPFSTFIAFGVYQSRKFKNPLGKLTKLNYGLDGMGSMLGRGRVFPHPDSVQDPPSLPTKRSCELLLELEPDTESSTALSFEYFFNHLSILLYKTENFVSKCTKI